jgi:hypothetical protein
MKVVFAMDVQMDHICMSIIRRAMGRRFPWNGVSAEPVIVRDTIQAIKMLLLTRGKDPRAHHMTTHPLLALTSGHIITTDATRAPVMLK